jgi:hypothetical protein
MKMMHPIPAASSSSSDSTKNSFPAAPQSSSSFPFYHPHQQQQQQYANYNVSSNSSGISGDDLGAAMAGLNFSLRASEDRMMKHVRQLVHPLAVLAKQQHQSQRHHQAVVIPVLQEQLRQVTSMMNTQADMLQQQQTLLQQQNRLLIQQAQYMQALHTAQVEMKESLDRRHHMNTLVPGAVATSPSAVVSPPAAAVPPLESGQDDPICATTAMLNVLEIAAAEPATVGQTLTPKQNYHPSPATVTTGD